MRIRWAVILAILALPTAALADTLTVDDVVALSAARLGDEAIVAKIQSTGTHFDLSAQQMIALRQRGVSSAVIAAMIGGAGSVSSAEVSMNSSDPARQHPPGLYGLVGAGPAAQMVRLDPTTTSQMKTSGILGYALTSGIASMGIKVTVSNASARLRTSVQPTFYFFFDESRPGANTSSFMGASFAASSPIEFNLVHLERKGDHRETKVGKMNLGGAKMGVMDKDRLQFRYDAIRPGVFRVTPTGPLEPGEYGFLYSVAGAGMTGAMAARIFDFGVEPGGSEPRPAPVQTLAPVPSAPAATAPGVALPASGTPRTPAARANSRTTFDGQSGFGNGRVRCVTC